MHMSDGAVEMMNMLPQDVQSPQQAQQQAQRELQQLNMHCASIT